MSDERFGVAVARSKTYIEIWKEMYNLPATDERYLSATENEVFEDILRVIARNHREEFEDIKNGEFKNWKKKVTVDHEYARSWVSEMEKKLQPFAKPPEK